MPKPTKLRIAPKARRQKVNEIYLVVSGHGSGEAVYTITGPGGEQLPLVGLDQDAVAILKVYSQRVADESGKIVRIVRFTGRTLCETVRPLSTGD